MDALKKVYRGYVDCFLIVYAFLSGFVFFEPSLAEYAFLMALPGLLARTKWNRRTFALAGLLFVPLAASAVYARFAFGILNRRFLAIDAYLFLLFVVARETFGSEERRESIVRDIFRGMALASFVGILAGVIVYATNIPTPGMCIVYPQSMRLYGFFKDTNVFASYMLLTFFYHANEFFETTERRRALLAGVFSVLLSVGILLTFSRAAWMAYGLGLVVILVRFVVPRNKDRRLKVALVTAVFLAALILLFSGVVKFGSFDISGVLKSRFGLISYDTKRFVAQEKSFEMFSLSPLLGVGPGNYEEYSSLSAHNSYARILGERGLLSVLAFMVFAIILARCAFRGKIELALALGIAALLLESFFIDTLHWRHLWLLLLMTWSRATPPKREIR